MTNFVLLYHGGPGMAMSEAEREAIMADWTAWYGKLGAAVVDGGNPFGPEARTVDANGTSHSAVGVPATGYTVISADSLDAAADLCGDHPHVKHGGQVAIYETFQVM